MTKLTLLPHNYIIPISNDTQINYVITNIKPYVNSCVYNSKENVFIITNDKFNSEYDKIKI